MADDLSFPAFRIAIRADGGAVYAYLAPLTSMDGAVPIASASKRLFDTRPEIFEQWKAFLRAAFTAFCEDEAGITPAGFVEQPGPEHERGGNA